MTPLNEDRVDNVLADEKPERNIWRLCSIKICITSSIRDCMNSSRDKNFTVIILIAQPSFSETDKNINFQQI